MKIKYIRENVLSQNNSYDYSCVFYVEKAIFHPHFPITHFLVISEWENSVGPKVEKIAMPLILFYSRML